MAVPVGHVLQALQVPLAVPPQPLLNLPAGQDGHAVHTLSTVRLQALAYCPVGQGGVEQGMHVGWMVDVDVQTKLA